MQISVSGHHYDISDGFKSYVEEEATKLERFYSPIIGCQLTVTPEGRMLRVDIVVNVHAQTLKASHESDSIHVSVDGAMGKMVRQLKKLHDKRRKPRPEPEQGAVVETEE